MKSYTPGPWIHEATSEAQLIKSKQGYLIAEVAQDETYDYAADMREAEANAHLIEAAPDLLEALKDLLPLIETCDHPSTRRGGLIWTICDDCGGEWADDESGMSGIPKRNSQKGVEAALTAIAKAEGRQ